MNTTELFSLDSSGLIITQLMLNALDYYHPGRATLMISIPEEQENNDKYKLAITIEILKKELVVYSQEVNQTTWLRSYEVYQDLRDSLSNEEIFNLFFEYFHDELFESAEDDGWFIEDVKAIDYFKKVIKLTNLKTLSEEEWLNKKL